MRVFLLCSLPLIRCAPNLNCSVLLYKRCYCYEMVWKLLRCSPVMILEDKHRQQWMCFELWTFLASYVLQLINHTSFVAGKYFISMTEKKRNCLLPAINLAQHLCCSPIGRTHPSSVTWVSTVLWQRPTPPDGARINFRRRRQRKSHNIVSIGGVKVALRHKERV